MATQWLWSMYENHRVKGVSVDAAARLMVIGVRYQENN